MNKRAPLYERIREARLARGLTQRGVADAVGYRREWVAKLERGRIYSPELSYKLARLLKVRARADDFFTRPPGGTP